MSVLGQCKKKSRTVQHQNYIPSRLQSPTSNYTHTYFIDYILLGLKNKSRFEGVPPCSLNAVYIMRYLGHCLSNSSDHRPQRECRTSERSASGRVCRFPSSSSNPTRAKAGIVNDNSRPLPHVSRSLRKEQSSKNSSIVVLYFHSHIPHQFAPLHCIVLAEECVKSHIAFLKLEVGSWKFSQLIIQPSKK